MGWKHSKIETRKDLSTPFYLHTILQRSLRMALFLSAIRKYQTDYYNVRAMFYVCFLECLPPIMGHISALLAPAIQEKDQP